MAIRAERYLFILTAILLILAGCDPNQATTPAHNLQVTPPTSNLSAQYLPFDWPIVNPGGSWNVPRISLPSCMGLLRQYQSEWWYYVGYAEDDAGETFSLQLQMLRSSLFDQSLDLQITGGFTGIGQGDTYLWSQAYGMGVSDSLASPKSLTIPPVSNSFFQAVYIPWMEFPNVSSGVVPEWRFAYNGGAALGAVGSRYTIFTRGNGTVSTVDGQTGEASYELTVDLTDRRGMVMEGLSGYVGPDASKGEHGAASYEYAQPILEIIGGTLSLGGETHHLVGGNLWLDRQVLTQDQGLSATPDNTHGQDLESFEAALPTNLSKIERRGDVVAGSELYIGTWMGIVLDNGASMVLASFWQKKSQDQWITGTLTGQPPLNTFGNLYFPEEMAGENGGLLIHGLDLAHQGKFDFDVNILNPEPDKRSQSPHWTSPGSGQTYATAWWIRMGNRLKDIRPDFPENIYLFALTDCTENLMPDASNAFWEGAARICADPQCQQVIGHAFVEQMGFTTKTPPSAAAGK
jgi:hypothetical protein